MDALHLHYQPQNIIHTAEFKRGHTSIFHEVRPGHTIKL